MLNYLFVAECLNGNTIVQTPADKSLLDPSKSTYYDVRQNLPLKSFSLVGKGDTFCVDFRDLSISINDKKHFNTQFTREQLSDKKIVLVYHHDTIQIARNTIGIDKSLVRGLLRKVFHTEHYATINGKFTIGWEAYDALGRKVTDFIMTIDN